MITLRPANKRGHSNLGWLDSRHSFSFSDYYDPAHMGFGVLRVINDDRIEAAAGFGTHPHRDMEIITYVLEGTVAHRDSMGHTELLRAGEVQRMSAGTGLTHSEFNASEQEPLHLYQIWLIPDRAGHTPSYEQRPFSAEARRNQWQRIIRPDSASDADGSLAIHQDASLYLADLEPGRTLTYSLASGRRAWVQALRGVLTLNGQNLQAGDGAAVEAETEFTITTDRLNSAEVLLFDLP